METVEVLVRIPKKDFEELQSNYVWWGKYGEYIKNGTVLPKRHGRLIDADKIIHYQIYDAFHQEYIVKEKTIRDYLEIASDEGYPETILEADKEVET